MLIKLYMLIEEHPYGEAPVAMFSSLLDAMKAAPQGIKWASGGDADPTIRSRYWLELSGGPKEITYRIDGLTAKIKLRDILRQLLWRNLR
jgi:hypothetical protein